MQHGVDPERAFPEPPNVNFTDAAIENLTRSYQFAVDNGMIMTISHADKMIEKDAIGKILNIERNSLVVGYCYDYQVPKARIKTFSNFSIAFSLPYGPENSLLIAWVNGGPKILSVE